MAYGNITTFGGICTHRIYPDDVCEGFSTGEIIRAATLEINGLDAYLKISYLANQVASWNNSRQVAQIH